MVEIGAHNRAQRIDARSQFFATSETGSQKADCTMGDARIFTVVARFYGCSFHVRF